MRRFLLRCLLAVTLGLAVAAVAALWWVHQPLALPAAKVELVLEPGVTPRAIAQAVANADVRVSPELLYWWFRLSGQARRLKAGNYELEVGVNPLGLLRKLVRGEEALLSVTLVEGWTFRQMREALGRAGQLRGETVGLSDETVMNLLGRPGVSPEGRFFPDTYSYAKGSTDDLTVLRRALHAMDRKLAEAWAQRQPGLPLGSPEDALILASIIEKETGLADERATIAGVFINRLRLGIPLATDPSVIYSLGAAFDGNLRKRDLRTDTPWNTYTRAGLPPTPIAMPSQAALLAAVQPAPTQALYFVARGDGSSQFSNSLNEHNRAVAKYQRGRP